MAISRRTASVQPSVTLAISAKAKQMKAEGRNVISLSAGEPDFDTPEHIKEAAVRALKDGFTKYTPATGIPELKEAVCEKFFRDNGLEYKPSQVIVNCGAKHSIYLAIQALVEEGDEVVVPVPYWVSYPEQVKLAGGRPVFARPDEELKLTPESLKEALSPRTKAVILNSPCNPSGVVYTEEELGALGKVLADAGVWVISDEIYEKLVYDGQKHLSVASVVPELKERTIVVNGVSKAYAMTGWRIGYAAGPEEVISAMGKVQSQETSNPNSIAQAAALAALRGPQDCVNEMVGAFDERRRYVVGRLKAMPGVSCPVPQGAFYVFPDVSELGKDSVELCNWMLEELEVACVPGAGFGMEGRIRISYAAGMEALKEAMDRLEEGFRKLREGG
ncbi:MAG: aspartate aminotransferase [Candidatus Latescibacterota bacterium]|nr:MAG: aspartate aminotransferase [Candidatus Latescibacterota bacterium]